MLRHASVLLISVFAMACASIPPPDAPEPDPEPPKRPVERHRGLPIPQARLVERGFEATRLQATSSDFPLVDARCLDPPPQWQPGDPPWDGSAYEIKFCVPHQSVSGVPYHLGDISGCGVGAGFYPEVPGSRWHASAWLAGLQPGEVVVWPVPNTLIGVHLTAVACAAYWRDSQVVSDVAEAMMDFPGPPEPPAPEPVAGIGGKARVVLSVSLAVLGAAAVSRHERENRRDATATGGRGRRAAGGGRWEATTGSGRPEAILGRRG